MVHRKCKKKSILPFFLTTFFLSPHFAGAPDAPITFTWTPNSDTPDVVYYQSAVHQKLGWKIQVVDKGAAAMAPATATAPAPAPASTGATLTCVVTISGVTSQYQACLPLSGVGTNYNLAWNLTEDSSNPGSSILSIALNATSDGYVALGFPKTPKQMLGSYAMVLKACATCPSGAEISGYYLEEQTPSGVKVNNELGATNTSASSENGVLAGKFQLAVPASSASEGTNNRRRRRSLFQAAPTQLASPLASFPFIFSAGAVSSNGNLQIHSSHGDSSIDLTSAQNDDSDIAQSITVSTTSKNLTARTAHMWLMVISFGFLLPIGVIVARWWPPAKNSWAFQVHRGVQTFAFLAGCGGIAAGFVAVGGWNTVFYIHRDIGMAVLAAFTVQVLSLVLRPSVESKLRRPWVLWHSWLGRAGLLLAIANIYYGIIHVAKLGSWAWATYTAVVGVLVVVVVAREIWTSSHGNRRVEQNEAFASKAV